MQRPSIRRNQKVYLLDQSDFNFTEKRLSGEELLAFRLFVLPEILLLFPLGLGLDLETDRIIRHISSYLFTYYIQFNIMLLYTQFN
jgi:hypothetical protein